MIKGHHILNAITAAMIAALPLLTSSCIYDDDEESYQIGEPTMLARFIISIGNDQEGSTVRTRQTAAVTQAQATPVFRGMQDIVMIPFNITGPGNVSTSDHRIAPNLTLPSVGSIPTAPSNNTIASLNATSQSQVYQDVSIALGTNAFLCYGKATGEDNAANGSLNYTGLINGNPDDISFSPKAIYTGNTAPAEATALAAYLTIIANTNGWDDPSVRGKMKLLRENFTTLQHAGSAANVLATLQKLYDALAIEAGELAGKIRTSMKIGTGENDILHLTANDKLAWNDNVSFKNYPASIGGTNLDLPDGAAYIKWNSTASTPCFEYVIDGSYDNVDNRPETTPGTFVLGTGVDLMHYATPAPLYYRGNTRINVSNQTQLEHYQSTETWTQILGHYESVDGAVSPATRSIALKTPLEYAVARMDLAVKAATATLLDNENEPTNASDLELTGVLVNGQYAVDYEFNPITTGTPSPYIIYDNTINTPITLETNRDKTSNYTLNHTLVLQSVQGDPVDIYLEFKNNSDHDITTLTGLVPPGCKLYLAGTITLGTGQSYVFEQDKITTFVATISDLTKASNVVPTMDVGRSFSVQVAVKEWVPISIEDHPIFNW